MLVRSEKQSDQSAVRRVKQCKAQGVAAVVVLGHPDYYPKFGFVPSR